MSDDKPMDPDAMWRDWFTIGEAGDELKRARRVFRLLPSSPRCKLCNAPFVGVGGSMLRVLMHKERSALNPHFCNNCEEAARRFPGGAEVDMSILFADIRGSTALAEKMSPREYSQLINRFYTGSTKVIIDEDGLVEKLAGDEVVAFWGAGFAGTNYVRRTVMAAQNLMGAMAQQGIPVGIGVHCGIAYFGSMNTPDGLSDISAKGEAVNTTARLCSSAAAGEIIVSEQAFRAAGIDGSELESRSLQLKGITEPVRVRVMHGANVSEPG